MLNSPIQRNCTHVSPSATRCGNHYCDISKVRCFYTIIKYCGRYYEFTNDSNEVVFQLSDLSVPIIIMK